MSGHPLFGLVLTKVLQPQFKLFPTGLRALQQGKVLLRVREEKGLPRTLAPRSKMPVINAIKRQSTFKSAMMSRESLEDPGFHWTTVDIWNYHAF